MNKVFTEIMDQKISRKEFLWRVIFFTMTVFGFKALLQAFSGSKPNRKNGYGGSSYGGEKTGKIQLG